MEWIPLAAGGIVVPEECSQTSCDRNNEDMIKFVCGMVYIYTYSWNSQYK